MRARGLAGNVGWQLRRRPKERVEVLTNELAAPAYAILKHDELDQLSMTLAQVPVGQAPSSAVLSVSRKPRPSSSAAPGPPLDRRHPDHHPTGGQQVPLEPGRQVPAILDRPAEGGAEPFPAHLIAALVSGCGRRERLVTQLAGGLVYRDEDVGLLVGHHCQRQP